MVCTMHAFTIKNRNARTGLNLATTTLYILYFETSKQFFIKANLLFLKVYGVYRPIRKMFEVFRNFNG